MYIWYDIWYFGVGSCRSGSFYSFEHGFHKKRWTCSSFSSASSRTLLHFAGHQNSNDKNLYSHHRSADNDYRRILKMTHVSEFKRTCLSNVYSCDVIVLLMTVLLSLKYQQRQRGTCYFWYVHMVQWTCTISELMGDIVHP